jgi:DNA polymerase delta subunit 2
MVILNASLQRRYGYDHASFSGQPIETLSQHLFDVARSMPVHVVPGWTDPCGTILPQQAMPRAMFGSVSALSTFHCETNPAILRLTDTSDSEETDVDTPHRLILATAGQTIHDMFKYVRTPPVTRLSLAEATLRWRHIAPTAPDTLWCHPYFTSDPFILANTPDFYVIGNQPEFQTKLVEDKAQSTQCRIILLPSFSRTGTVVLANLRTLEVRVVRIASTGMDDEAGNPHSMDA